MAFCFRRMREEDLDAVYKIETDTFSNPWLREFFEIELQHDSFVVEKDGDIAGYICAMQVLDECTVTNVAIRSDLRRQGMAEYMMRSLERMMDERNIRYYYLEVRASNSAAKALYHKLGYKEVGIRKDYYHHPTEDAIVMSLNKSGAKKTDERF